MVKKDYKKIAKLFNEQTRIQHLLTEEREKPDEEECEPLEHDFKYIHFIRATFWKQGQQAHIWCRKCGKVKFL